MDNLTKKELIALQEVVKKVPKSKKQEIKNILDMYLPVIEKQLKKSKKELELN